MNTSEYEWRRPFIAVLTEIDPEQLPSRLTAADDAVFYRLLELEGKEETGVERLALEDTMQDFRLLRDNCFRFRSYK
jgi:hypothetical protein